MATLPQMNKTVELRVIITIDWLGIKNLRQVFIIVVEIDIWNLVFSLFVVYLLSTKHWLSCMDTGSSFLSLSDCFMKTDGSGPTQRPDQYHMPVISTMPRAARIDSPIG